MKLMAPPLLTGAHQQALPLGCGQAVAQAEASGAGLEGEHASHGPGHVSGIHQPLPEQEEQRRERPPQALRRSACFSGISRTRLPVAAKMAFITAGAATAMVGSPTPPQNPPEGMTMLSTAGISASRIIG